MVVSVCIMTISFMLTFGILAHIDTSSSCVNSRSLEKCSSFATFRYEVMHSESPERSTKCAHSTLTGWM